MNKQELITRIEQIKYEHLHYNSPESMLLEQKHLILDLVEQFDEPQKPVVPKFVSEWFEDNKDVLDLAIFMAIRELDDEEWQHKTDFENWLDVVKNKPLETLIRMKDGYEVKKEPMYYIKLPSMTFDTYIIETDTGDLISWQNTKTGTPFTEKRIKDIDERYWAFAVPVEEG